MDVKAERTYGPVYVMLADFIFRIDDIRVPLWRRDTVVGCFIGQKSLLFDFHLARSRLDYENVWAGAHHMGAAANGGDSNRLHAYARQGACKPPACWDGITARAYQSLTLDRNQVADFSERAMRA